MLHLHAQLQQKLQLDYKTNITPIYQKIKLYASLTTKDLKKPRSFRLVGGTERQRGAERCGDAAEWVVPHSCVVDKNWQGDTSDPWEQVIPDQTTQPSVLVPGR